jgi:hypothetical protein
MLGKLKDFPNEMADELTDWQTEDMKRKYPNTELKGNTAETDIWPHSRSAETEKQRIKAIAQQRAKRGTGTKKIAGFNMKGLSSRPILQPDLYAKLCDRMDKLMQEKITWR